MCIKHHRVIHVLIPGNNVQFRCFNDFLHLYLLSTLFFKLCVGEMNCRVVQDTYQEQQIPMICYTRVVMPNCKMPHPLHIFQFLPHGGQLLCFIKFTHLCEVITYSNSGHTTIVFVWVPDLVNFLCLSSRRSWTSSSGIFLPSTKNSIFSISLSTLRTSFSYFFGTINCPISPLLIFSLTSSFSFLFVCGVGKVISLGRRRGSQG